MSKVYDEEMSVYGDKVEKKEHPEEKFLRASYDDRQKMEAPTIYYWKTGNIHLQFCGWELVLLTDGTYYINDTTG